MATKVMEHLGSLWRSIRMVSTPRENEAESSYKPFYNVDTIQKTINFFNSKSDSYSTNSQQLVGGNRKEWRQIIENIGQRHMEPLVPHQDVEEMVNLAHELEKRVYYPPYTLDPKLAAFDVIKNHAITRQGIKESTADKYLGLAKLMETHPVFPVNFRKPHWTNFFQYMDHIKMTENATPNALKNRRKAWGMFCKAWGTYNEWPTYKLPHIPDRTKNIVLPTPETVKKLLQHRYTTDKYLNRLIQYHFFTGFMIGLRPEKEMVILNLEDLHLDEKDNYTVRIVEPKKNGDTRVLRLENNIAISKTRKSMKNYVDTIRPKFADPNEKALLVNPETGKRWTENDLRFKLLYRYGKQVWPRYWPYVMRHWCATARSIEWKKDNTVLYRVKYWMGHVKLDQTLRYLDLSKLYDQGKGSWLSRALKQHKHVGGMYGLTGKEQINEKMPRFVPISRREKYGPGGIRTRDLQLRRLSPYPV